MTSEVRFRLPLQYTDQTDLCQVPALYVKCCFARVCPDSKLKGTRSRSLFEVIEAQDNRVSRVTAVLSSSQSVHKHQMIDERLGNSAFPSHTDSLADND